MLRDTDTLGLLRLEEYEYVMFILCGNDVIVLLRWHTRHISGYATERAQIQAQSTHEPPTNKKRSSRRRSRLVVANVVSSLSRTTTSRALLKVNVALLVVWRWETITRRDTNTFRVAFGYATTVALATDVRLEADFRDGDELGGTV